MAGRISWLLTFFRRAEPRGAPPSGWALAFDAAVAVGATAGTVFELAMHSLVTTVLLQSQPGGPVASIQHLSSDLGPGALASAAMTAGPGVLAATAMTTLPLSLRRFYPISVWLVVAASVVVVNQAYLPPVALVAAVYAAYSAVSYSRYQNLAITAVCAATVVGVGAVGNGLPKFPGIMVFVGGRNVLSTVLAITAAVVAARGTRKLRRRLADSNVKLYRAAADARAATEAALAAERSRIASELHDVVTHNVSVMIVQAGAARKILASSPADAEDALLAVESTGREAMTELRNLLGLLSPSASGVEGDRSGGAAFAGRTGLIRAGAGSAGARTDVSSAVTSPTALRPQPGLGELDTLISRVSAAGLPVKLTVTGEPRPLPSGPDLAAYRVVQEGLTNVLRHAAGAAASVGVHWGDQLVITVTDDGDGVRADAGRAETRQTRGPASAVTPGRGLLGLRERLALYGGDLAAGPLPDGGWQVRAAMPTGAQST